MDLEVTYQESIKNFKQLKDKLMVMQIYILEKETK